jgi:predicted DNA-binding transcriptional regulator YafY
MSSNQYNQRSESERADSRFHCFRRASRSSVSPRLERLLLLLSYFHLLATLTASLLCFELIVSGGTLTHGTDFLSRALLPIGLLGPINIPFLFWIRVSGVRRFHFLDHEARLDEALLLSAQEHSPGSAPDLYEEMRALIQAIEAADVWDRPAARSAVKAWIVHNRPNLDEEALEYLRDHVGYLLPDE